MMKREPTYWTENGRLVVRERGCPEVQVCISRKMFFFFHGSFLRVIL